MEAQSDGGDGTAALGVPGEAPDFTILGWLCDARQVLSFSEPQFPDL